jgi:hypothetical protein
VLEDDALDEDQEDLFLLSCEPLSGLELEG